MKRILVVDESQAIRETLAVILGRDFAVVQRASIPTDGISHPDEVDLLILGTPAGLGIESSVLIKITSRVSCPILLLLDSKSTLEFGKGLRAVDCLAKPFNPYELKERVIRLLTGPSISSALRPLPFLEKGKFSHYLDFPYLPASTSSLAKRYAVTALPILILGEAGCGQERIARALYSINRNAGPWISANSPEIIEGYLMERVTELTENARVFPDRITIFLSDIDALDLSAQSSLVSFLEEEEERERQLWILSSSRVDLLEKVYRGEFLHSLYYRVATLTLRLLPLRERRNDLPSLAAVLAEQYGKRLGLGKVSVSPEAIERLCNYLWFGNLDEIESVIAKTLAVHRKGIIEATDLILGFAEEDQIRFPPLTEEKPGLENRMVKEVFDAPTVEKKEESRVNGSGNGHSPDIRVLITELAHELKNPMVTIKTFAQLLGERFDDPTFRGHFRDTVGNDIERMNDLLEALIDFSRFTNPAGERFLLQEQLSRVLDEIIPECAKREATIRWERRGENGEVIADEAQFRYAFKNLLRTVLAEIKPKSEIQIDVEGEGRVAVSYVRHEERLSPFTHYLNLSSSAMNEETFPLRFLLAKFLLERNGGAIKVTHLDGGRILVRAELPVP
jgi:two-component system response regulator PilR (NtrC family)